MAAALIGLAPAALVLVACGDVAHLPGLANELPNYVGGATSVIGTSTAGSSSSGSTSTSTSTSTSSSGAGGSVANADAGPAESLCDTAAALAAGDTGCTACESTNCEQAFVACMGAPANECTAGVECVSNCASDAGTGGAGSCIANCLAQSPPYETFIQCMYGSCASACGVSPPLACPFDAGTD